MKATFIIPPTFQSKTKPAERSAGCTRIVYPFPNIYELTAAAVMREAGWEVALEDFVYEDHTPEDLWKFLTTDRSDVYAMWCVNLSIEDDNRVLDMIAELRPESKVLLFGPAPTYFPAKFLNPQKEWRRNVTIIRGEPEETLRLWCEAWGNPEAQSNLDGLSLLEMRGNALAIRANKPRKPTIDFDHLPFPARDLLGNRQYHNPKLKTGPYTTMLTSRNCPFQCIYCVPSSLSFAREIEFRKENGRKPPISYRSADSVTKELELLHAQGYRAIGFVDDNFIWNQQRTEALCRPLKRLGFKWGCQARVDAITEPIAKLLGESGCGYVDLGMESFNDDILRYIKKGITSEQIFKAIGWLQKYNVPVKLNFLIGTSPLETKETIRDTLRKAKKLKVDQVMFNIVSPFPGTELYEMAKENGWLRNGEYTPTDVQRESILNYPHLTSEEMERLLFKSNLKFFLDPRFVVRQLKRFRSVSEFTSALKALKIKLFG